MDRHPIHTESQEKDEFVSEIQPYVLSWEWVKDTKVRLREHGQVYFGEIFVIPHSTADIIKNAEQGRKMLQDYHWKIHDVVICPVADLPE